MSEANMDTGKLTGKTYHIQVEISNALGTMIWYAYGVRFCDLKLYKYDIQFDVPNFGIGDERILKFFKTAE